MKISERAKRIWKFIVYAVLAIIAITAIAVVWNKWFSRTRIAFINYQATTLGEISKANNNPFQLPITVIILQFAVQRQHIRSKSSSAEEAK